MRRYINLIAALAVIALLALAITGAVRLTTGVVRLISTDGGSTEPDPMFAEETELTTRPPELVSESGTVFQDNSANWDTGVQTPVDKTAEELAREESAQDNAA